MRVCNELYHYGVPGMKWGVRKSSYSSSKGKNRFSKKKLKKKAKAAKIRFQNTTGSRNSKAVKAYRKKDINRMSNKDLQTAINRMNLEKNYRSLTKRDLMLGNKVVKDVLAYGGTALAAIAMYESFRRKFG